MTPLKKLDALGIDALCVFIEEGKSQAHIARDLKIDKSAVTRWIAADEQRSARAKHSRLLSAETLYELADQDIEAASDMFELAKAKERGQHRRRWAAIRNPREYGDKIQTEHSGEVTVLGMSERMRARKQAKD